MEAVAETAKNGFRCIKMYISQKGQTNIKNGKKLQKIAENCK